MHFQVWNFENKSWGSELYFQQVWKHNVMSKALILKLPSTDTVDEKNLELIQVLVQLNPQ